MSTLGVVSGLALILFTLLEGFESIVLPRRVTRPYRFTVFFYRATWRVWNALARLVRRPKWRETVLSYYGPLSLLTLFAFAAIVIALGPEKKGLSFTDPGQGGGRHSPSGSRRMTTR